MNRHLLTRWSERGGAGDTIICLGDVGHPDVWRDLRLVVDVRDCPGQRLLILGNHDVDHTEALQQAGFGRAVHGGVVRDRAAIGGDADLELPSRQTRPGWLNPRRERPATSPRRSSGRSCGGTAGSRCTKCQTALSGRTSTQECQMAPLPWNTYRKGSAPLPEITSLRVPMRRP